MKWSAYNQSLVRRGEILIGFDIINNWDAELKEMNKDKVEEPFHYPDTFLLLLGYAKEEEGYKHTIFYNDGITADHVIASASVPINYDYTIIEDAESKLVIL